jgi:hypothetical protein
VGGPHDRWAWVVSAELAGEVGDLKSDVETRDVDVDVCILSNGPRMCEWVKRGGVGGDGGE